MPGRPDHSTLRNRIILAIWRHLPVGSHAKLFIAWMANARYAVGVAAVIVNDRGEVLVLKHTYRRGAYEWGIPGGWAKGRASMEHELAREMLEETGFSIKIARLIEVQSGYPLPRLTVLYLANIAGGEFRSSDEVADYRFCRVADLPAILPAERRAIERALLNRAP
jgi:8-oxo-dGTP diphosphatase